MIREVSTLSIADDREMSKASPVGVASKFGGGWLNGVLVEVYKSRGTLGRNTKRRLVDF